MNLTETFKSGHQRPQLLLARDPQQGPTLLLPLWRPPTPAPKHNRCLAEGLTELRQRAQLEESTRRLAPTRRGETAAGGTWTTLGPETKSCAAATAVVIL